MDPGIVRHVGARLLGEVEEESLESVCLFESLFLFLFFRGL